MEPPRVGRPHSGFEDEGGSQIGYSNFLKSRIAGYARRKNQYEDTDLMSEARVSDKGVLNIYFKDDTESTNLHCT